MAYTIRHDTLFLRNRPKMNKSVSIILACFIASTSQGLSRFKSGDGIYIASSFLPEECKKKMDGHYVVSNDGTITFSFMQSRIDFKKDIKDIQEDLSKAIGIYLRKAFPEHFIAPAVNIIPDIRSTEAVDGVLVLGQARRPGIYPIKEGFTIFQAVQTAGGGTEYSTLRYVSILREKKTIDCDLTKSKYFNTPIRKGDVVVVPLKCFVGDVDHTRDN